MPRFLKHPLTPLLLLLTVNLTVGFLTFRNYGLSWDEPLFYDYADSIWKAYTPQAFTPGFDFDQVYGKSMEDHKIYGPAYVLLARPLAQVLISSGLDLASAWHLVNFLTFQLGLVAFYRLMRRWLPPWPSIAATAFFAWQPVFWGHAFINPKDAPFMVFFLWALVLGLEMVDNLPKQGNRPRPGLFVAGIALGLTAAIRVIGPLAGVAIFLYFLSHRNWRAIPLFVAYGLVALVTMFVFWPYLWFDPLNRLVEVLRHMSDNPTELAVLFMGQIFRANEMPRRYLPTLLGLTLTEPTWFLVTGGLTLVAIRSLWKKTIDWRAPAIVFGIFGFMMAYLLYNIPAMYDGFRHFLFLLPPVFVAAGFTFGWIYERTRPWLFALLAFILLLPGILGIAALHPYEYAYYNRFAGGVGQAFRTYETEYWLTCYKEALAWVRTNEPATPVHIQREMDLAEYYGNGLSLKNLYLETESDLQPGDLLLFHTRADLDLRSVYRKYPIVTTFGRENAEFCILKRKE